MPADYQKIREDNREDWGKKGIRLIGELLPRLYSDRAHFIYELLQNAEDALGKRTNWRGQRLVTFSLDSSGLTVSHFGKLFDEKDVVGICSAGESTKLEELTSIGQFGIGFKSVYNFTSRPEIHSGDEHFAIESLVFPHSANERALNTGETQIIIPFNKDLVEGETAKEVVFKWLQTMATRTLLFLREIEEIAWSVDGRPVKRHRSIPSKVSSHHALNVRQVRLVGPGDDLAGGEQWIVFSRPVEKDEKPAGFVEIAFLLEHSDAGSQNLSVCSVADSKLFVFFPTKLKTNLGFLMHGPYNTPPSRENINHPDSWNQYLAQETATLLVESLRELRGLGWLNASALQTLPLKMEPDFDEGGRFAQMFQAVKDALLDEKLLPAYGGGHIAGKNAKLAKTGDLQELIGPEQLAGLFPEDANPQWIGGGITSDQTPEIRNYLRKQLVITEVTPDWLVRRLTQEFLEAQPDEWIMRSYEFFNGQKSVLRRLPVTPPLVRLETGVHTVAFDGDAPQAYLPSKAPPTGFPTVKSSVCQSNEALEFLRSLKLREPDPVDYVIRNILPKYDKDLVLVSDKVCEVYRGDLAQALNAYESASREQRQLLAGEIGKVKFTIAVDAATNVRQFVLPGEAYWPTDSLKALFQGVSGVLLLDDNIVPGEAHNLLAAAGTPDRLARKRVERELTEKEKYSLRRNVSNGKRTRDHAVRDYTLMGLKDLLDKMDSMPFEQASERAKLLWKALCEFQSYRGDSAFKGRYSWHYYSENHATFPANFVKRLSGTKWVPDGNRQELQSPTNVAFADIGWEANPSLAEKIGFLSSDVDKVAENEGIDREALHYFIGFLKKNSNIPLTQIKAFLLKNSEATNDVSYTGQLAGEPGAGNPTGFSTGPRPATDELTGVRSRTDRIPNKSDGQISQPRPSISITLRTSSGGRNGDGYGDGDQHNREVEDAAIKFILNLKEERFLNRTKDGNPGFDLWEPGPNDQPKRWIEVKSSAGALSSVTLSITQFRFALKKQNAYWLYVVENATTKGVERVSKIQNPAQRILDTIARFNLSPAWIREHQSGDNPEEG